MGIGDVVTDTRDGMKFTVVSTADEIGFVEVSVRGVRGIYVYEDYLKVV